MHQVFYTSVFCVLHMPKSRHLNYSNFSRCLPLSCTYIPVHVQDSWEAVRVGEEVVLRGLKPCVRCKMTCVHPEEGYFTGEEPLKTLKMLATKYCFIMLY